MVNSPFHSGPREAAAKASAEKIGNFFEKLALTFYVSAISDRSHGATRGKRFQHSDRRKRSRRCAAKMAHDRDSNRIVAAANLGVLVCQKWPVRAMAGGRLALEMTE